MSEGREDRVRKTDQFVSRMIELWPVWGLLVTMVVGGITFWNRFNQLWSDQQSWKATSEDRREKNRAEFEEIHIQLAEQGKDIEWLKKDRK